MTKTLSFGDYSGLLMPFEIVDTRAPMIVKFTKTIKIKAITGTISSFPRLHAQFVLRLQPKKGLPSFWILEPQKDVFGVFNCGNTGRGQLNISGLNIVTDKLYFYWWAHNMHMWFKDFHGSYTIYYEEVGNQVAKVDCVKPKYQSCIMPTGILSKLYVTLRRLFIR